MLMNAPAVYTAVTSSLHVRTPLGPTTVHVNSISMETVKTASTLWAVSIVFIRLGKKLKEIQRKGSPLKVFLKLGHKTYKPKIVPSRLR